MGRESEWDLKTPIELTASWLSQPVEEIKEIFLSAVHASAKEAIRHNMFTRALVLKHLIASSHNFEQAYVISAICSDPLVKMSCWAMHMGKIFPKYPEQCIVLEPQPWAYELFSKIDITDIVLPQAHREWAENLMHRMAETMRDDTIIPDVRKVIQETTGADKQLLCIAGVF